MKTSVSVAILVVFANLSSAWAVAECQNPHLKQAIDRLSRHAELAQGMPGLGNAQSQPMTMDWVLDRAPMSEDFGPERIGPYTVSEIYRGYLDEIEREGKVISADVIKKDMRTLNRLCEQIQGLPENGNKADMIDVFAKLESADRNAQVGLVALLGAILLSSMGGIAFTLQRSKKREQGSIATTTPLRPKKDDSNEQDRKRAA